MQLSDKYRFWCLLAIAFASNAAAGSIEINLLWQISTLREDDWLLIPVVSMLPVVAVLGASAGGYVANRHGLRTAVVAGLACECFAGLLVVLVSSSVVNQIFGQESPEPVALAACTVIFFFSASIAGPAWIRTISDIGAKLDSRARYIGFDSIQYQSGRTLGFIVGGFTAGTGYYLFLFGSLKIILALVIVIIISSLFNHMLISVANVTIVSAKTPNRQRPCLRTLIRQYKSILVLIVILAVLADPARSYLARSLAEEGHPPEAFGVVAALFGLGGVVGGLVSAHAAIRLRQWWVPLGFLSISLGLATWSLGSRSIEAWGMGAVLFGLGAVMIANYTMVIASSNDHSGADAITLLLVTRTIVASVASPLIGLAVFDIGAASTYGLVSAAAILVVLIYFYKSIRTGTSIND